MFPVNLFHNGVPDHIETSPFICRTDWVLYDKDFRHDLKKNENEIKIWNKLRDFDVIKSETNTLYESHDSLVCVYDFTKWASVI